MKRYLGALLTVIITASMLLAACSQSTTTPTSPGTPTSKPTATTRAAPTPTAKPTATMQTPQYGGTVKIGFTATPSTLIPETQTIKQPFEFAAFETLLKLDEKGALQPNLATNWKFSSDYKSLTVTLRRGVKFHDGTDFNAAAAKFNLEIRKAAKLGDFEEIASIDIVDDYTFRINLSQFLNSTTVNLRAFGGMMESPTAYQKYGKDQARWNPVGTGPFKFVSYDINQSMKYTRFDAYWQAGKPYLDGYQQTIIADRTTLDLALRAGEIDACEGLLAKQVSQLRQEGWPIIPGPTTVLYYFYADTANADSPFANQKVREALEYAIDMPAIDKSLGYGQTEALTQLASSDSYAYDPTLKGRSYDPAKAKQLLTEAGYPNGLKTTIVQVFQASEQTNAVQGYLRAVGIDAPIDTPDRGRYLTLDTNGWKNMLILGTVRTLPDWLSFTYSYLSTTSIRGKSWARPQGLQDLLEAALAARDEAAMKTACQKINKKLFDTAAVTPLWGTLAPLVHAKKVHNLDFYTMWSFPCPNWDPADVWISK